MILCRKTITLLFLTTFFSVAKTYAQVPTQTSLSFDPIYAGTIYEPSPLNQDPGEILIQPFYHYVWSYGMYDNQWSRGSGVSYQQGQTEIICDIGIIKYVQFQFLLTTQSTFYQGKTSSHLGDTTVGLGFQFLWQKDNPKHPNLRAEIQETFPTGRYDHLDPHFRGNNATGTGAYTTTLLIEYSKILYGIKDHPVLFNVNASLEYSTPVNISGTSAYGPLSKTKGRIGHRYQINFALAAEYSITRHWVFGLDFRYHYKLPTSFTSRLDDENEALDPLISSEATNLVFLAPCIEYNFSERCGLVMGGGFTVIGQNIDAQAIGSITLFVTY